MLKNFKTLAHDRWIGLFFVLSNECPAPGPQEVSTRVMIFSSYRESVQEIAAMLNRHAPLIRVMTFMGQASTGKGLKGFTQKEQLEVDISCLVSLTSSFISLWLFWEYNHFSMTSHLTPVVLYSIRIYVLTKNEDYLLLHWFPYWMPSTAVCLCIESVPFPLSK